MDGQESGVWLDELATPIKIFADNGLEIDLVSVHGGRVAVDPRSKEGSSYTPAAQAFNLSVLEDTPSLSSVDPTLHVAVFFPGGPAALMDLPEPDVGAFVTKMWTLGKIVGAVGHGTACFVRAVLPNGTPVIRGKPVTGISNEEGSLAGFIKIAPFLLEDQLRRLGGQYSHGPSWKPHVVACGNLITGQNPASAKKTAENIVAQIKQS